MIDRFIETFSGIKFDFVNPKPEMINIRDIAHGLSNICRFNGQCKKFYSVAQHSVFCVKILRHMQTTTSLSIERMILLHDAEEAYISDIARPIKDYYLDSRKMFKPISDAITKKYKLTTVFSLLNQIDLIALTIEAKVLMPSEGEDWATKVKISPVMMSLYGSPQRFCMMPGEAEYMFLDCAVQLGLPL